ncbi:MAG: hypothetical protein KIIPBIDF_01317 [Candidatus Methanoperedenaceae archaeon GB50]|nr:MAG: hypothetical protein KIIPBIDF_01317 [Candidatus Methanoperedenaceae archaeon GB50]
MQTEVEYVSVQIDKSLLQKVKELFKVEADTEAVKQALEEVAEAKELQEIVQKHKGVVIQKVYE